MTSVSHYTGIADSIIMVFLMKVSDAQIAVVVAIYSCKYPLNPIVTTQTNNIAKVYKVVLTLPAMTFLRLFLF